MYYVLLCLRHECCGTDIMNMTLEMTGGRVRIGPGTLYNLLEQFADAGMIRETGIEGRKRSYILTDGGEELLGNEYQRLIQQIKDYDTHR